MYYIVLYFIIFSYIFYVIISLPESSYTILLFDFLKRFRKSERSIFLGTMISSYFHNVISTLQGLVKAKLLLRLFLQVDQRSELFILYM